MQSPQGTSSLVSAARQEEDDWRAFGKLPQILERFALEDLRAADLGLHHWEELFSYEAFRAVLDSGLLHINTHDQPVWRLGTSGGVVKNQSSAYTELFEKMAAAGWIAWTSRGGAGSSSAEPIHTSKTP